MSVYFEESNFNMDKEASGISFNIHDCLLRVHLKEFALSSVLAYMAPEVFTKNMSEGHGRAADIWSVGCVIVEMTTGNRPWHELESNYQIMFKVRFEIK